MGSGNHSPLFEESRAFQAPGMRGAAGRPELFPSSAGRPAPLFSALKRPTESRTFQAPRNVRRSVPPGVFPLLAGRHAPLISAAEAA